MLREKLKEKKSEKKDFLILFLNFALIKYLTPHPNPLLSRRGEGIGRNFLF
jgi:hypothetical protein